MFTNVKTKFATLLVACAPALTVPPASAQAPLTASPGWQRALPTGPDVP
jgi:hypothetical protein